MKYTIKITGQGPERNVKKQCIDRTFHDRLYALMSSSDWIYFCDQVDAALDPLNDHSNTLTFTLQCVFTMIVVIILSTIIYTVQGVFRIPKAAAYLVILILVAGPVVYYRRRWRIARQTAFSIISNVSRNLTNICDTQNAQRSSVVYFARSKISRIGIPSAEFTIEYVVRAHDGNEAHATVAYDIEGAPVIAAVVAEDDVATPTASAPPFEDSFTQLRRSDDGNKK